MNSSVHSSGHSSVNFSLTQLEYVLAVYRLGHFAQAAASCHVSQPTLSMQIQKLENDLGFTLFDRSKKPVLLTPTGQRLMPQFQVILEESKKVEGLIKMGSTLSAAGLLHLAVIPTLSAYVIPKLLPVLEKKFPNLELKISEMQTSKIISALEHDEIDVGLLATPLHIQRIEEFPLFFEPFSVLCRKDNPLAHRDEIKHNQLGFEDIWLLEEGHCLRNQVIDVCAIKNRSDQKRHFRFESGNLETLKGLIDSYGGYTLLPKLASEQIGKRSRLIPFQRPVPAREIGLVYRRKHYKSELIEALGDSILLSIPEEVRRLRKKDLEVLPVT